MKRTIFLLLSAIIFFSCKKDKKDPEVCTTSVASIAGSYKITSMLYKESSSGTETEVFPIWFDACDRDNILTFNTNGTYHTADAGTKCSPPGDDDGTWSLNGTTMNVDGDPTAIESFDCKKLILVNTDTQMQGDQLKITLTRQ